MKVDHRLIRSLGAVTVARPDIRRKGARFGHDSEGRISLELGLQHISAFTQLMHVVNLQYMVFADTNVYRLRVGQLFLNEERANDEGYGDGELKHDQAVPDTPTFESGAQFSFQGFYRLERRQVQRWIASGCKSHDKYESCEGSEKVWISKVR